MPYATTSPTALGSAAAAPADSAAAAGYVSLTVTRRVFTPSGTGGYTVAEAAVDGSPFLATLDHAARLVKRDEAAPGVATIDNSASIHFQDPSAPVRVSDVVTLPDGQRALVTRVRAVGAVLEADLELGAAWQAPA